MTEATIFAAALDRTNPADRAAFLADACAGNDRLRRRVEALLKAHAEPDEILTAPPRSSSTIDYAPITEQPGTVIGPYKLLEQIGEGGFGVVFIAEQHEPIRRRVALKVLKPGMDTRQVIARFEAERQALAIMDHPNIARVFDGGATHTGRPYFVMEFVKGVPITQFCDEHTLSPRQRLELFIPVCQAIQHAHQKGVIHRDLKPSNILVSRHDTTPVVKVIDFGVAKALGQELTDKTLFTGVAQIIGTPLYMSPEQAGMSDLDVDTRSDIYSLGVLLYELLTGSTPVAKEKFKKAAYDEIRRIIRDEEPPKPSTRLSESKDALPLISAQRQTEPAKLTKLVRGELDWIVMKCLEKDRNRRYETASGVAKDIERYLADEPVLACPPSAGYRLKKFARRNRGRLAAAAVLSAALLVAVGAAAWSIGWVTHDHAERQSRLTRQAELILDDVDRLERGQKWREAQAGVERAEAVLAGGDATNIIQKRAGEARRDLAFVAELDRIRQARATTVEGHFDNAGAARNYARAFREYGADLDTLPVAKATTLLQRNPALIPPIVDALDDWSYAIPTSSKAVLAVARSLDPDPMRNRLRATVGQSLTPELRAELRQLGESIDAKAENATTVEKLAARLGSVKLDELGIRILKESQFAHPGDFWLNFTLGSLLAHGQDYGEAQTYSSIAASLRPDSAAARSNVGMDLLNQGKYDEAIACLHKAIELDPKQPNAYTNLGAVYYRQKNLDQAIAWFQKAIELAPDSATAYNNFGVVLHERKRLDQSIACFRKAIALDGTDFGAHANLASVFTDQGKLDDAITCLQKAIELDPHDALLQNQLGFIYFKQKKWTAAIVRFRKAIELDPQFAQAYSNLGLALAEQKKLDEAITCYRKAIELDSKLPDPQLNLGLAFLAQEKWDAAIPCFETYIKFKPESADAPNSLGYALLNAGKLDEAIPALKKAIELSPKDAIPHDNLGLVYLRQNDPDKAAVCFRTAADLDPGSAEIRSNLGVALAEQKKLDEAVACYRKALELDPKYAYAHDMLGLALQQQGKLDEAISENCEAVRLDPKETRARKWLVETLAPLGRLDELRAAWEQALAANPPDHEAWYGYAELCLFMNNEDAYRRNRTALLKRFGDTKDPGVAERTARACLLLPATGDELKQATALADRAVELGKDSGYFAYYAVTKSLAEYRMDRFKSAIEWGQKPGTQGICPMLLILAMAHERLGHTEQARQCFDEAIKTYDWKTVNNEWGGISHSLRREAETLLKVESGVKEPIFETKLK